MKLSLKLDQEIIIEDINGAENTFRLEGCIFNKQGTYVVLAEDEGSARVIVELGDNGESKSISRKISNELWKQHVHMIEIRDRGLLS